MHPAKPPVKWKMTLLTWVCLYPLLNVLSLLLLPHIGHWPPPVKTLVMTLILVPLMGVLLGVLQRWLAGWLTR